MILREEVHHPDDVSNKYLTTTEGKRLHSYFNLLGKYVRSYPTTIIKRDGSERKMDWLILVDPDGETIKERTLINVEFQSYPVDEEKIKAMADYCDYSKTFYGLPLLTIIIITHGYETSKDCYERTVTDILKPIYIHMSWEEITEKLNNLEAKILNQKKLSDDEALDIAYLPMFAPKNKAEFVTEKIARLYCKEKSVTGSFRNNIAYVLTIMIRKNFDGTEKGKELLSLTEKDFSKADFMSVIEYELNYRDQVHKMELAEKDSEISKIRSQKDAELAEKDSEIAELKAKLKKNGIS